MLWAPSSKFSLGSIYIFPQGLHKHNLPPSPHFAKECSWKWKQLVNEYLGKVLLELCQAVSFAPCLCQSRYQGVEQLGPVLCLFNLRIYLFIWGFFIFLEWLGILLLEFLFPMLLFLMLFVGLFIVFLSFSVRIGDFLSWTWMITSHFSCVYLFFTWSLFLPMFSWMIPLILMYVFCLWYIVCCPALLNELFYFINILNCTYISINFKIEFFWIQQCGWQWFSPQSSNIIPCSSGFRIIT